MNINRRSLLGFSALVPVVLMTGCAGKTPAQVSMTILTTLENAVKTVANAVPEMAKVSPSLFPAALQSKIASLASDAEGVISSVTASMTATAAATPMNKALSDLSAMLSALSVVPIIPPPFGTYLAAASIAVTMVGGYISSLLGTAAAANPGAVFMVRYGAPMTPAQTNLLLSQGATGAFVSH